jgi:hypothetical protein
MSSITSAINGRKTNIIFGMLAMNAARTGALPEAAWRSQARRNGPWSHLNDVSILAQSANSMLNSPLSFDLRVDSLLWWASSCVAGAAAPARAARAVGAAVDFPAPCSPSGPSAKNSKLTTRYSRTGGR